MAAITSSCLGTPQLRSDWSRIAGLGRLDGRITSEEALWGVIITMGIAVARANILATGDVEWLVLHFFCLWGPVSSSVNYSSRFNDVDIFHHAMWGAFLLGLTGSISFLDHSLVGLAWSTCALYLIIAVAFLRVAWLLPRARKFCIFWMASNIGAATIFALLALFPASLVAYERGLLWINLAWEPVATWVFFFIAEEFNEWDLPVDIFYVIARFDGFHMMTMVCTFLFPIGLQGKFFQTSAESAANVIFGNIFALALKLSLQDVSPESSQMIHRHALHRSRVTAFFFILIHPFSMLGIYMTGVGFVASIIGKPVEFSRPLMCIGSAMTWSVTAVTKSLHSPENAKVHHIKTATIAACSLAFLVPLAFRMPQLATSALVATMAILLLGSHVAVEWFLGDTKAVNFMKRWWFSPPRALKTWGTLHENIGAQVSGMEHFFTVLFAVAVFQLNEQLIESDQTLRTLENYAIKFMIMYGMLLHTMQYASRFGDDDGYHKLLWAGFQVALLIFLEGAAFHPQQSWSLYKIMATAIFLGLGIFFSGRVALHPKREALKERYAIDGRYTACYFSLAALLKSFLMGATCLDDGFDPLMLRALVATIFLTLPVHSVVGLTTRAFSPEVFMARFLPLNIEYIVERFDGLVVETLGVAFLVPNAIYPGAFPEPQQAALGILCAVTLVLSIKASAFDVEPVNLDLHAVRQGPLSANIFFLLHPLTILGMSFMGGSLRMLIESAGNGTGPDYFAQQVICLASALTLGSATLTKWTHKAERVRIHAAKVVLGFCGLALHYLLWVWPLGDDAMMVSIAGLHGLTVISQLTVASVFPYEPKWKALRRKSRTML